MRSPLRLLACVVVLALAGCGEDAPERAGGTPAPTAEPPAAEAATPARTPRSRSVLDQEDADALVELAGAIGGQVGLSVGPVGDGGRQALGPLAGGSAWSTIKVPIALRVLEEAGGPEGLTAEQDDLIARALTASDNAAAAALWAPLGASDEERAARVEEVLRAAGDDVTEVSAVGRDGFSPYGQTEWALPQQQALMAQLAGGCLADAATTDHVLELMGQVAADQQWGLGSAGVPARYKGGWGPGTDGRYLVRQMGVVELDGRPVAVAMAALPDDGQFATGTQMLTELGAWLVDRADPVPAAGCSRARSRPESP
jgi:beta-lactamase class A